MSSSTAQHSSAVSETAPSQRVLMTGGRGRVGTAIFEDLAAETWSITRCSRTGGEGWLAMDDVLSSFGSLDADGIIHCAWSSVPASAGVINDQAIAEDVQLIQRWIARLKASPVPPLFVFISSGAVYGAAPGRPSRETDEAHPQGAYAAAKLAAERLLLDSGLPVCILRVAPLYGLNSDAKTKQGVISHLVAAALHGTAFSQWGEDSVKDYLHRVDFCEALRRVVAQRLQGGIWNLGSGIATHLTDLVKQVEAVTGCPITVNVLETPVWDVRDNRLDITKLCAAIDWQPRISLAEGIALEAQRLS